MSKNIIHTRQTVSQFFVKYRKSICNFSRLYSTSTPVSNENIKPIVPLISYLNADLHKVEILKANRNKTGIYKWTHLKSGKSYIGSAIDLSRRFKNYYNLSYLEREKL
uniref:GIY-YIG domain-containing protein n=1 Tax=Scytalidium sp. TaxID=1715249 RepID=A0A513U0R3_9PEZI|nr:hypothetical protein [Scytalidium sp.]